MEVCARILARQNRRGVAVDLGYHLNAVCVPVNAAVCHGERGLRVVGCVGGIGLE